MEVKLKQESDLKSSQITIFKFELNRSQTSLFLILSFLGIFMIPFILAGDGFLYLFGFLFSILPAYLSDPSSYYEDYLIYTFYPILIRIIIYTIFLIFSFYALRKILRNKSTKNKSKRKTINQDRVVNWFGLKMDHGQSLFIFSVSLVGAIFIAQQFLEFMLYPSVVSGMFESVCLVPDGPNRFISHEILSNNVPPAMMVTIFLICLYSLFIVRRGKPRNTSKRINKNYSLLVFIVSFVVLIILSAKLFCHLALFTDEISSLLGISYNAPNSYQNEDFIKTLSAFIIFLALMITSFFLKERKHKEMKSTDELSWLRIKLTPNRVVVLLSSALLYVILFTFIYLVMVFLYGSWFGFLSGFVNFLTVIFVPIIFFCLYPIGKILKNHRFETAIEKIDNFREYRTNWFGFNLSKSNSVILLSVSSGSIFLYIYQLFTMNMSAQAYFSDFHTNNFYLLFSFPVMVTIIFLILVVIVYTIKKTLPSIKSSNK